MYASTNRLNLCLNCLLFERSTIKKGRDYSLETNTPQAPQEQYAYQQYQSNQAVAPIVTVKEWLITMLIMIIPIVNLVMIFVYAFSSGHNPSKSNFFKAYLIMACIIIGLYLLLLLLFVVIFGSALASLNS